MTHCKGGANEVDALNAVVKSTEVLIDTCMSVPNKEKMNLNLIEHFHFNQDTQISEHVFVLSDKNT